MYPQPNPTKNLSLIPHKQLLFKIIKNIIKSNNTPLKTTLKYIIKPKWKNHLQQYTHE